MAKVTVAFRSESITITSGDEPQTINVSQLVPAGAALLTVVDTDQDNAGDTGSRQGQRITLSPGDNVELSPDKKTLVAKQAGYPSLLVLKEGGGEKYVVDLEPLFIVDDDGWTAKITLYPPTAGCPLPKLEDIMAMLAEARITYGIREKNIAANLATAEKDRRPVIKQVIARGRLPVNGEDAWLRLEIDTMSQVGKELGDGHIDYRDRHMFTPVSKGQLLATKVRATGGLPGVTVLGQEVAQRSGKDLSIKKTEDIIFNEETGEISAAVAGVLSAVNDASVRVTAKLTLSGDIDFATGNIESRDAVEIGGSIRPGFKVITGGDLVVGGSVESAHIISHGNVVIRGGVLGGESSVEVDGDIEVPVLDNGTLSSKGSIKLGREAYYGEIRCLGDMICLGQARIVSCDVFAGGSITAVDVDTDSSPNSLLAAATMPERYNKYLKLLKAFHQAKAAADASQRRIGPGAENRELKELQEELVEAKTALAAFNVIPGVGERDKMGGLRYACRQRISIKGTVQLGAVVRIGNTEATLKKGFSAGYFALNAETGKLEFHYDTKAVGAIRIEPL